MTPLSTVAWAAGLFEGEGTCYLQRGRGRSRAHAGVTLAVNMTDEDVVRRFHQAVGVGRVSGPYSGTNKPTWVWRVGAASDVAKVIWLLKDYLSPRRRQQIKAAIRKRHA